MKDTANNQDSTHALQKFTALTPKYVTQFKCIGADCEDTCCSGWQVAIDKQTFDAYQGSENPRLKERFREKVIPIKAEDRSVLQHASIALNPESHDCAFLEERLCAIQAEMGESYLSNTCFDFPRSSRLFGGQFEQSLSLACPEAARKALTSLDAFDFVETEIAARPASVVLSQSQRGLPVALCNDIRTFCIQVLRSPDLQLWERLAILGLFCEELDCAIDTGPPEAVLMFLNRFAQELQSAQHLHALDQAKQDPALQSYLFAKLWHSRSVGAPTENQRVVQSLISKGLGIDESGTLPSLESLIENYLIGLSKLSAVLTQAPQLLDYFVLNEAFKELFPFGGKNAKEHFLTLITRLGMVRLMLAGFCKAASHEINPAELSRVIQVFCRRYLHDRKFSSQVNQALQTEGLADFSTTLRLLKA